MTLDIKNFYLKTPMKRYEYLRLKITTLPDEIIEEYKLKDKVDSKGYVYVEVRRGMYGLPHAGLIAQQLLEQRLQKHGYEQSKITPGFWKHKWRPIAFSLVVDDFGVKIRWEGARRSFNYGAETRLRARRRLGRHKVLRRVARLGLHK